MERAPKERGDFSIDPAELAILPLDATNRGLHIIKPDAGFAFRNGFAHNPSLGGHPAILVPDLAAVKSRLEKAGVLVTDADDFIGPAALALAHRYNLDSRDAGRNQRQEVAASNEGVWDCTFVGACSQVCPKHVDPAAAIQQTKISSSIDWFQDFLMPWRKR